MIIVYTSILKNNLNHLTFSQFLKLWIGAGI